MRLFRISFVALALCICTSANGDFAVAPGSVPIETLFEHSAVVCNCYITNIQQQVIDIEVLGRPSKRCRLTANVAVRDFYKSDESSLASFSIQYVVDEQQGMRVAGSRLALAKGETALLFLTKNEDGTFEFADPFVGAVQFSSLPTIEADSGPLKLQAVLTAWGRQSSADQLTALQVLLGFQYITDGTRSAVRPLTESADPIVALTAIGILLRTKSVESVQRLELYLRTHKMDTEPLALFVIGPEVGEVRNYDALPILELLGQSKYRSIKSGALQAIRGIKSQKSIPYLIAKLNDPDRDAQYAALITAAEILDKYEADFAPSMYLFDQKPEYYVGLWKQWWIEEGGKLYPQNRTEPR